MDGPTLGTEIKVQLVCVSLVRRLRNETIRGINLRNETIADFPKNTFHRVKLFFFQARVGGGLERRATAQDQLIEDPYYVHTNWGLNT